MPTFTVEESIHIAAEPSEVFRLIRDFKTWPSWSPWLLAEPDTKLEYAADGSSYSWDGKITGAGSMAVLTEEGDRAINCQLRFLRPWKSTNTSSFQLKPENGGTQVTWNMCGSLPFFLLFMKRKMTSYISADYQRGLAMMKDLIETESTGFSLDFAGIGQVAECHYLGIRRECPMKDIGPSMNETMAKLTQNAEAAGIQPSGPPFSIYEQWNPVDGTAAYILGFPVATPIESAPTGCTAGTIPATPTYQVQLTGAYRHLGNAWAAGMMHQQAKVFPSNPKIPPFEVYENDPETTPEGELVTTVHLPAKN